jgi:hypothetical protein
MSELIQEFLGKSIEEWEKWYLEKNPDAIPKATVKIALMIDNFRSVMDKIDRQLIERWVRDMVIIKTFIGLRCQEAILAKVVAMLDTTYRLAEPSEESRGIDGYVGDTPISIKPESYRLKESLHETIEGKVVYYEKTKEGVTVDISGLVNDLDS